MSVLMYFWDGERVREFDDQDTDYVPENYNGMPCLDPINDDPLGRYGMYTKGGWVHIPFTDFPPEFKTNLMLLGVT